MPPDPPTHARLWCSFSAPPHLEIRSAIPVITRMICQANLQLHNIAYQLRSINELWLIYVSVRIFGQRCHWTLNILSKVWKNWIKVEINKESSL